MKSVFPNPLNALDAWDGLVAQSFELTPELLLDAYHHGIFPWVEEGGAFYWFCPPERLILNPQDLRFSKSFYKTTRGKNWQMRWDEDFDSVIKNCAHRPKTWISESFIHAYTALFHLHWAHAVGVYAGEDLIGGLYGVQVGRLFCGESMFFKEREASKMALYALCQHAEFFNIQLLDCQTPTPHFLKWGAKRTKRADFLKLISPLTQNATAKKWVSPR